MRIGLVLSSPPGYSETFFTSKIKGLTDNGNRVTLFCQAKASNFNLCEVKVAPKQSKNPLLQVWLMLGQFLSLIPHLKKVMKFYSLEKAEGTSLSKIVKKVYLNAHFFKTRLDWVHFGFATMALERELVPKAIGAKTAVSFRGFDIAIYPIKNPNCYRLLWQQVDKVHTISDDLLQLAYKWGLPKTTPYSKITPAINTTFFNPKERSHKLNEKVRFLTVARLHWKKGLVATLEALSILKDRGYKFEYAIVGAGKEFERIAFAIDQLNLGEDVQLIGKQSPQEVLQWYEDSDIYLQYSISEGFCNAVLEAQAMGLLCVVSDAEGLSENVLNKETGWVVPKNSPELLANQIEEVLKLTPDEKIKISSNAMKRVKENFNIEQQQQAFVNFYQ